MYLDKVNNIRASFFKWANPGLSLFIFVLFTSQFKYKLKKAYMCYGFEPRAAGWQALTNPLSYGNRPYSTSFLGTQRGLHKTPSSMWTTFRALKNQLSTFDILTPTIQLTNSIWNGSLITQMFVLISAVIFAP